MGARKRSTLVTGKLDSGLTFFYMRRPTPRSAASAVARNSMIAMATPPGKFSGRTAAHENEARDLASGPLSEKAKPRRKLIARPRSRRP